MGSVADLRSIRTTPHLGLMLFPTRAAMTEDSQFSLCGNALVRSEAVEQSIAAGTAQVGLATAAIWSARRMRRIPRLRRWLLVPPHAVVVTNHGGPLAALRPVATGPVLGGRKGATVWCGAGKDVVA